MTYSIELVNHASVLVSDGRIGVLSDPWYRGDAFHKGWSLLVETDERSAREVLSRTTHIWLSHEHPDHFSVAFFKTHGDLIRSRGIVILFQETADRRVVGFLRSQGLDVVELGFGARHELGEEFAVVCVKDGFYDSALSMRVGGRHILNLNDCNVRSSARADEIRRIVGECDVLLTQFSYAAWKGGRKNPEWRRAAARDKLAHVDLQARALRPKAVIPFASFVRFANELNCYLNDSVNTPRVVLEAFGDRAFRTVVMKPGDVFDGTVDDRRLEAATEFWEARFAEAGPRPLLRFDTTSEDDLREAFELYVARVHRANSRRFMKLARALSPVRILAPVVIRLHDLDRCYVVDIVNGAFEPSNGRPDLEMSSESLWFIFRNAFGFDTLTVNGCFEEIADGGFARVAKSLAIESLNNLGIAFSPRLIFQARLISTFLGRLFAVSRLTRLPARRREPMAS